MSDTAMKSTTKVLLADDDEIFREGLARLLEESGSMTVTCKCDDGNEVLSEAKTHRPDLVLLKIRLPGCDGIKATKWIVQNLPETKVVIVTDSQDEQDLFNSLKAGAKGYLLKSMALEDFIGSVKLLARGGFVVSPKVAGKLVHELSSLQDTGADTAENTALTEREREIVALVAKGSTNREIGEVLFITENTVKVHVKNVLEKLQLKNKQQVAAYAVSRGLVGEEIDFTSESD